MARKHVFVVCGNAGVGKTTYGRRLAEEHGAALLDIDTISERLVQAGLRALGMSTDDRDSPSYKALYRDAIHETLFAAADDNLDHVPCVIVPPFTQERRRAAWPHELRQRLRTDVQVIVLHCDLKERKKRLAMRGNPRDQAKLADWQSYAESGEDPGPPPFEHLWVDTSR